jgi:hypothetical protein
MFTVRRPDAGQLLGLVALAVIYLHQTVIRGTPLDDLEVAFFASTLLLMTVAAFTKEFLGSPLYPLVGGALIAAFASLQYVQTRNPWLLLGTVVGIGFGIYGLVDPLNDATAETE